MHFIVRSQVDETLSGSYFHFEHRDLARPNTEFLDFRPYIHCNQDLWLREIHSWHAQLSQRAIAMAGPNWWLTLGSRLVSTHPPVFSHFFTAIAVLEICKQKGLENITLIKFPHSVIQILTEINTAATLSGDLMSPPLLTKCPALVTQFAKAAKFVVLWLRHASWRPRRLAPTNTVIYSHLLSLRNNVEGGDHFFGKMFQDLSAARGKQLWVYFLDINDEKSRVSLRDHAKRLNSPVLAIQDYINPREVFHAAFTACVVGLRLRKLKSHPIPISCATYSSSLAAREFFNTTIAPSWPFLELAHYYAFRSLWQKTRPHTVCYPYEEKPLERALLKSCLEAKPAIQTLGLAHAVHNPVHLYLLQHLQPELNPPKPSIIATSGPVPIQSLHHWAQIPIAQMTSVGSKRNRQLPSPLPHHGSRREFLKVLVLAGLSHELPNLAKWTLQNSSVFAGCHVTIRKYPYDWQQEQDDAIEQMRQQGISIATSNQTFMHDVETCDVFIYCATSAAFEAMVIGRCGIHADLNDTISCSPLVGSGGAIPYVTSSLELQQVLQKIKNMTEQDYRNFTTAQCDFATKVYSPVSKDTLERLLTS